MVLRQEQENMQKRAKEKAELEQQLAEFLPLIHEANLCSGELKRKFKFSAQLQTKLADSITNPIQAMKHRKTQIACKVDNYQDGYSYVWPSQKFKNRLYIIRDIINEYFDTQQVPHLEKEQDPWWDPPEAQLIGYSYASLQNLSYLIQNQNTSSIIGLGAGKCGHLTYAILPCGQNGQGEPDEDLLPQQSAEELIGKRFDFKVQIKSAKDLPLDLCNEVYVTYQFFLDDQVYETQKAQGHNASPVFDFSHHHTVDMATKGLIDYLKSSNLKFNVYGQSSGIKKKAVMQEQKKMPKSSGKQKNDKAKPVVPAGKTQNLSLLQNAHQNDEVIENSSTLKRQKIKEVGNSKGSGCCTVF